MKKNYWTIASAVLVISAGVGLYTITKQNKFDGLDSIAGNFVKP